jgi:chromosome segregation ATPase
MRSAIQRKSRPRSFAVAQEVIVLGERVHFQEVTSIYSVNFKEKYFLQNAGEDEAEYTSNLITAQGTFSAYFSDAMPNQMPLKPCSGEDYAVLKRGLETRFSTLREEVKALQAESGDSVAVREGVEHLLRIKAWLEGMEANEGCFALDKGATQGIGAEGPRDIDEEQVAQLLRNFAFLVLQAQGTVPEFESNQRGVDAGEVVDIVQKVSLNEPEKYKDSYETGERRISPSLLKLLVGAKSEGLLETVYDEVELDKIIQSTINRIQSLSNQTLKDRLLPPASGGQVGGGTYQEKINQLNQIITALLEELEKAEQRVRDAEAMLPTKDQQLIKLAADLAAAQAQLAAHGASTNVSEAKFGELTGKLTAAQEQLSAAEAAKEAAKLEAAAATSGTNKSVEEVQAQIAALQAAQKRVNQERDTAKAGAEAAIEARDILLKQIEGLKSTIAGHAATIAKLEETLNAKQTEVAALLEEKKGLQQKLRDTSLGAVALEAQKRNLERSHGEALRAKDEQLRVEITKLKDSHVSALSEKATEITAQRQTLANEKEAFAAQLEAAQTAKGEAELAKGNLETELAEQQKRTSTAAALAARHSAQLRELAEQKEAADAQLASLQDVKEKLAAAIAANQASQANQAKDQAQITDLQEKLNRVTAARQTLLEQQEVAKASIEQLNASLREAEAAKSAAETKSGELEAIIARLEAERKAAERDIEELTKQLSQAQDREVELSGKVRSLEAQVVVMLDMIEKAKDDKQKAIDGLRAAKAKELAEQKAALETQHKAAEEALQKEIEEANAAAATQKAELEAKLREVETELRKSQNAYEFLEAVLEKTKAEHANALEKKEAVIRRMEQDNSALLTKLAEGEAEAKRMREEIAEKTAQLAKKESELRAAEAQTEVAVDEITELREKRATLAAEIAGLKAEVERLGGEVATKEASLDELGKTLDKSKEELSGLNQTLEKERASFTAQSQAFNSERDTFKEQLREAGERERAQAEAATEERRLAATAAQEAAASAAEQAAAIAAAKQAAERLEARAITAEGDKAVALQRAETAVAAENSLFMTVLSLATRISEGQTVDDIIAGNERFREIYSRMEGLVKAATKPGPGPAPKPSGDQKQRSCYLNYFISFFLRQFFFSGSNLPEKQATYASVKTMVDEFLSEHSDMELTSVITDIFNLLRVAETPGNPNLQTQFPSMFKTFFRRRAGSSALTTSLKEYFMEGFKGFQAVASREPISGITYPVLLATYIATAQKFLVLRQSELAAYCPVPPFLLKPSGPKQPKRGPIVIKKTRDALVPVEAAEAVEETEGPPTDKDYARLGLHRGAKLDAVRKAYLRKALQTHPNKGGDPVEFKRMKASYERIKAYLEKIPAVGATEEAPVMAVEDAPAAPEPVAPEPVAPEPAAPEPEPVAPALEPEPVPLDPTPENYQRLGVTEATSADGIKRSYANKSRPDYSLRPDDPNYSAKLKRSYDRLMHRRRSLPGTPKKKKPSVNNTRKIEPTTTTRAQLRASWNALAAAQAAAKQAEQ